MSAMADYISTGVVLAAALDPEWLFNSLISWLLDMEAKLEELLSSQACSDADDVALFWLKALRREHDDWALFDERWQRLRGLLQYRSFEELEIAYTTADAYATKHPKNLRAQEHRSRLEVLWLVCADNTAI